MHDVRKKIADIKELIEQKILHPYVLKYIKTPVIDEDKLLILVSMMDQRQLSLLKLKKYAVTTMLIQIALDTHELVSNSSEVVGEEELQKKRQLTVLAGDYYSGLYYKLLAEADEIALIRSLAEGIKEVNEHKILVYQKDIDEIENLMNSIKMIEGSLLIKLIDYIQANEWKELLLNVLFVKRLLGEKVKFVEEGHSVFFQALKKIVFPKNETSLKDISKEQQNYLLLICDRYIDFSIQLISKGVKQLPGMNKMLEERISAIFGEHHTFAKTLVEEG